MKINEADNLSDQMGKQSITKEQTIQNLTLALHFVKKNTVMRETQFCSKVNTHLKACCYLLL